MRDPRLSQVNSRTGAHWDPPERMPISAWSEANRYMPKGTTPRPGNWRCDPYQVEILDACTDPDVREVTCIKSTQVGWSEMLNCILLYFIVADPRPSMLVQPTIEDAKGYSKKRIAPAIENCEKAKHLVRRATSRKAGNTLLLKEFPGGFLKLVGANSGTGLRSDPIGLLVRDEADAYPEDVDGEGDPLEISRRRTDQYPDALILTGGTPAKSRGISPVEKSYQASSRGRYHVPCPHCGDEQPLLWKDPESKALRMVYLTDDAGKVIPSSVGYTCSGCGSLIHEEAKWDMVARGRWVHEDPENPHRGFYINALYSLAKKNWPELCQEWENAQDDSQAMKSFLNLRLGETFEETGEALEAKGLKARLEDWERGVVPDEAGALTAFSDVQPDRLEAQVVAWGPGEESWLVDYRIFYGPTDGEEVWEEFDRWLLEGWKLRDGRTVRADIVLVDSGYASKSVYDFVQPRQSRKIFASKGQEHLDRPGLAKEGSTRKARIRLFHIATDTAKTRIMSRLQKRVHGPGYIHLPKWSTDEYLEQLVAEKLIQQQDRRTRRTKRVWVKTRTRNEALDLEVGCMAGLFLLQEVLYRAKFKDLAKARERWKAPEPESATPSDAPAIKPVANQRTKRVINSFGGGFGGGW
nr:terminase gpA endonuclease subunit [uncultured Holophaga sp.]